jgi:ferric-dicitrate binding protein FerR (iron transport regulator)
VFNKAQEIEVLGTEFNIKAYKDESNIYTTLVEGKVAVNFGHTSQNLLPNQQAVLNINTNKLKIAAVEVYNEIAWKEGIFSFDGKPLKDILKVLSRWYDMEVVIEDPELENVLFVGKLRKGQSIEEILNAIKNSSAISTYEIRDKTIVLK